MSGISMGFQDRPREMPFFRSSGDTGESLQKFSVFDVPRHERLLSNSKPEPPHSPHSPLEAALSFILFPHRSSDLQSVLRNRTDVTPNEVFPAVPRKEYLFASVRCLSALVAKSSPASLSLLVFWYSASLSSFDCFVAAVDQGQ